VTKQGAVSKDQDSLASQTLRQLRHKASDLGVPLYSRKSKAVLIKQIAIYQEKLKAKQEKEALQFWRAPEKAGQNLVSGQVGKDTNTRVVFLPRDPEWAYVFWEISESDRKRAQSQGASRLCLRLSDLTGIGDGTAHRQTLQEIPVDSHSTEWYLPIPMSDRDYRVELGYRSGARWISLAFSSVARVPSLYPSDQILDQFVPFSLETPVSSIPAETDISNDFNDSADRGLHERLYQTATTHFQKSRIGSEQFQSSFEFKQDGFNESGSGIWASGRNESGLGGVAPRKRNFWLVADAELVVYGSTDPSATVTIAGEEVPLSSSGTFRLQVPFRDGSQSYPIEAKDLEGEQVRNITLNFDRKTPVDNTNPSHQSQDEWF
tara:strand:+ start:197 stop:1327 length:1131 start_codon:yes stop_codon:yes gene_type:complete